MMVLSTTDRSLLHLSHFRVLKMCLSAGLFPGTEYHISVQAIKGATEGKASSVTGVTGQCQRISIHHPFNLTCYSVTSDLANEPLLYGNLAFVPPLTVSELDDT